MGVIEFANQLTTGGAPHCKNLLVYSLAAEVHHIPVIRSYKLGLINFTDVLFKLVGELTKPGYLANLACLMMNHVSCQVIAGISGSSFQS
jgi:hypothetical protein